MYSIIPLDNYPVGPIMEILKNIDLGFNTPYPVGAVCFA